LPQPGTRYPAETTIYTLPVIFEVELGSSDSPSAAVWRAVDGEVYA
jgi:hypothetical protein